ncbi:ABC-2 type transport system ATP-binding protein [Brevinema andersonii]|uniref:ABC-2 type transport system ATP-binding protein n=1 Tax=Brevinema andersonii TaxID=34097 RepID=A0A1I1D7B1_BREAD|nr:ABC transporter ATP-binding protein [Brevinema andersonii]SFB70262.1 ABC-2 type transport system ATP-binding protein [Brevinema andersonii]
MVQFLHVSQNYGMFRALYDLSFLIKKGTSVALLGPNGAGKSTTMNIMTGYRPPTEGKVLIDGIDIFEDPEKAKGYIGYLAEIPPLYPELTVWEYLIFTGELHGLNKTESKKRTLEILDLLKISGRKDTLIRNLSKGLKQRVGIAQSILHKPKLLVLDEPTVGLEPAQLIEFRHSIRSLVSEFDMTVVLSTHIMSEASELCDDIIIINEGHKIFSGTKEELIQKKQKEYVYEITVDKINDKLLKSLEIFGPVHVKSNAIILHSQHEAAEKITETILQEHVGFRSITRLKDSLEDVFLRLTLKED